MNVYMENSVVKAGPNARLGTAPLSARMRGRREPCSARNWPALMPVASTTYNLNFTAASLRPELARIIAECYLAVGNWAEAKDRVLASNALQCRSAASSIRLERALRQRLQTLNHEQINLLAQGTAEDRAAIAWLAACKHIPFVFEFATEILREKLVSYDPVLRNSDYEAYVESKALLHPEIGRLTATSKNKVRQVLLRMPVSAV